MRKGFILFFLVSCSIRQNNISKVHHWGYQLQNYAPPYDLTRIQHDTNSLWVIDYSASLPWKDKISLLKKNKNTIISYLSIGEAEEYREYWISMNKKLIYNENKNWEGNHKVFYWQNEWQNIFLRKNGYIEKIMKAGFDGVYLDIIDAFRFVEHKKYNIKQRADLMAKFIIKIKNKIKGINPDGIVIIQNGYDIINYLDNPKPFLKAIDALAIEGVIFQKFQTIDKVLKSLKKTLPTYKKFDLPILSVEYIEKNSKDEKIYLKFSKEFDLQPLIAERKLSGSLHLIEYKKRDSLWQKFF